MPYIIAIVVIIVGSVAFFALRSPAEAPAPISPEPESEVVTQPMEEITLPDEDLGMPPLTPTEPMQEPAATEPMPEPAATDEPLQVSATDEPAAPVEPAAATTQNITVAASYFTPRRTEHDMDITFTLEGTTIVGTDILYDGGPAGTPSHSAFDSAYREVVIGQDINTVQLSRVGGASLTSTAFNEAVAEVRAQL